MPVISPSMRKSPPAVGRRSRFRTATVTRSPAIAPPRFLAGMKMSSVSGDSSVTVTKPNPRSVAAKTPSSVTVSAARRGAVLPRPSAVCRFTRLRRRRAFATFSGAPPFDFFLLFLFMVSFSAQKNPLLISFNQKRIRHTYLNYSAAVVESVASVAAGSVASVVAADVATPW